MALNMFGKNLAHEEQDLVCWPLGKDVIVRARMALRQRLQFGVASSREWHCV